MALLFIQGVARLHSPCVELQVALLSVLGVLQVDRLPLALLFIPQDLRLHPSQE